MEEVLDYAEVHQSLVVVETVVARAAALRVVAGRAPVPDAARELGPHNIEYWFRGVIGLPDKRGDFRARVACAWAYLAALKISDANLTMNGWLAN